MSVLGIIPARFASTRFPGKPLVDICGKPMIWWVYNNMKDIDLLDDLVVATDDDRIVKVCNEYSIKTIKTSPDCRTGSDRIAEVSQKIDSDIYIAIFGDEPLLEPENVRLLIKDAIATKCDASMLITKFKEPVDAVNTTTVKVAINDDNEIIFMSRLPIPFPKNKLDYDYYKHVGAYALSKKALQVYLNNEKGPLEEAEDVETLRLLENHIVVRSVLIETESMSVDTEKDLKRIKSIMQSKKKD